MNIRSKWVYHGSSMKAVLRNGDFLLLNLCDFSELRKGDIIAFNKTGEGDVPIVHRIIHAGKDHIVTKGDNNLKPDILPVFQSDLLGKVVAFERQGKTHRVRGGMAALIRARIRFSLRRSRWWLAHKMRLILPVDRIAGLVSFLWKPEIKKIKLTTGNGPLIKWVHRDRAIATSLPEKNIMQTSFFYRFFVRTKHPG
jgi:signal peptidase I